MIKRDEAKILHDISALKRNRKEILNNMQLDKNSKRKEAAILDKRIKNLEMLCFARAWDTVATSFFLYSKTVTKPWININKEQKARDCIPVLYKLSPNENELSGSTDNGDFWRQASPY